MKINNLITLLFGLFLAGCTTMSTTGGVFDTLECGAYTGPVPPCEGNPNNPEVTLNTNTLEVTPRCIKAFKSKTIKFNVVPPGKNFPGSVAIIPKITTNTWLAGNNSPDKTEIEIFVPDWVDAKEYSYGILKSTGDCRDPRVEVIELAVQMQQTQ